MSAVKQIKPQRCTINATIRCNEVFIEEEISFFIVGILFYTVCFYIFYVKCNLLRMAKDSNY